MLEGLPGGGTRIGRALDERGTKVQYVLMLQGLLCIRVSMNREWRDISSG